MFIHVSGYEIPCGLKYAISKYGIMHKPYISKPMLPYPSKLHKNRINLSYHVICLMTSSFEFYKSY